MNSQEMEFCASVIEEQLNALDVSTVERDVDLDHYFSILAIIAGLMKLSRADLLEDLFDHAIMLQGIAVGDEENALDFGREG